MIGILNAYHFDFTPGNYQEHYNKLITDFLLRTFPSEKVRHYKIASSENFGSPYGTGEWPLSNDECSAWIITGSSKSAYDNVPWVQQLQNWIREFDQRSFVQSLNGGKKVGKNAPRKSAQKLIGICFGHQVIAQALGGQVEKSSKGWGVGVQTIKVVKSQPWMKPSQTKLSLIFSHQDQVVELPSGSVATVLATNDFCPNQIIQYGKDILTFQGHPEFTAEFARLRLESRIKIITPEVYEKAMASFSNNHRDDKIVGQWLREFVKD
ncbi:MAG: hypothetical protein ABL927_06275 [Bdellovibrionales bacterium]